MSSLPSKTAQTLLLSLVLCSALNAEGPSPQDISLLKRVREHWKEGDFSLAKKQILAYLEKNPSSELQEKLHLLLGDLYFKERNTEAALHEYNQLKDPDLVEESVYNRALCLYEKSDLESLSSLVDTLDSHRKLSLDQKLSLRYLLAKAIIESQEKEEALQEKARELLSSLRGTHLEEASLPLLAGLYLDKQKKEEAAGCYLELAKKDIDHAPELCFQAALLLSETQPKKALALFEEIVRKDSSLKPQALYNRLVLEYRAKEFDKVLLTYNTYKEHLDPQTHQEASLLAGKSLYHIGDLTEALSLLFPLCQAKTADAPLLLITLDAAYQTQDRTRYKELMILAKDLLTLEESERIALLYLSLLKAEEQRELLVQEARAFLNEYTLSGQKETVLSLLSHALYEGRRWQEAEEALNSLVELSSPPSASLLRMRINCVAKELEESAPETLRIYRERWITLAKEILSDPFMLTEQERGSLLFELTHHLFFQEHYSEALETLEELATQDPNLAEGQEILLIQTLCHLKDPQAKLLFALSAEKVLSKFPQIDQASFLRLHLFNTYLQLGGEASPSEREDLFNRAADHLFPVFSQHSFPLQQENVRWLFEHAYKRVQDPSSPYLERALMLGRALAEQETAPELHESDLYRLSNLLTMTGQLEEKLSLLKTWNDKRPSEKSPLQKHLLFELAKTHEALHHTDEALSLYDNLIRALDRSLVGGKALLAKSQLLFSLLSDDEKTEDNPPCLEILSHLKDLSIGSRIEEEPLHLEASLFYVYASSELKEYQGNKEQRMVSLLTMLKERIEAAPDYVSSPVGQAYLQFIELELARLQQSPPTEIKQQIEALLAHPKLPSALKERVALLNQELSL